MIIPLSLCMVTIMVFLENHNESDGAEYLVKKLHHWIMLELQRVPLFIRVPGIEGGVNHEVWWTNRYLPTLLHLLGTDTKNYVQFGTDLLSEKHDELSSISEMVNLLVQRLRLRMVNFLIAQLD